jgi:hypothetical protein
MPTLLKTLLCYHCGEIIGRHSIDASIKCREAHHELVHGRAGLNNQMSWLHAIELTTKEPDRIGTQCCAVCFCFLPGHWGTVKRPDGINICGACARDIDHNCYENAQHINTQDSYMGSGDSENFWQCSICKRTITVGELLEMREADANHI